MLHDLAVPHNRNMEGFNEAVYDEPVFLHYPTVKTGDGKTHLQVRLGSFYKS